MICEFMTIDTQLPPCMPFPKALTGIPVSSTSKVMYSCMLDTALRAGMEDENGILFIHFPIVELSEAIFRSTMTVKRSLHELENAGLILRVRRNFQGPNQIYIRIPEEGDIRCE